MVGGGPIDCLVLPLLLLLAFSFLLSVSGRLPPPLLLLLSLPLPFSTLLLLATPPFMAVQVSYTAAISGTLAISLLRGSRPWAVRNSFWKALSFLARRDSMTGEWTRKKQQGDTKGKLGYS